MVRRTHDVICIWHIVCKNYAPFLGPLMRIKYKGLYSPESFGHAQREHNLDAPHPVQDPGSAYHISTGNMCKAVAEGWQHMRLRVQCLRY